MPNKHTCPFPIAISHDRPAKSRLSKKEKNANLDTKQHHPSQFPYALAALPNVLATQWDTPTFLPYRSAFPSEHASSPAALEAHVRDLTARDVKVAYLKNLQGYLWEDGYASGAYATPLFADVVPALKAWRSEGRGVAIYSSGSVFAQKLLMRHVKTGEREGGKKMESENLEGLVSGGWFDTVNAGLKAERGSYVKIAEALQVSFCAFSLSSFVCGFEVGMRRA
jgi:enolase-phosphatase E1